MRRFTSTLLATYYRPQSAHVATFFVLVALLGTTLWLVLPLKKRYGILVGISTNANTNSIKFIAVFSWSQGYTKRLVRIVILVPQLFRCQPFCIANLESKEQAKVLFGMSCYYICILHLSIDTTGDSFCLFQRRNKERRQYLTDIVSGKIENDEGITSDTSRR